MKPIAIIGYGRFGQLLAKLASGIFDVGILETNKSNLEKARGDGFKIIELKSLANVDLIFLAVPIANLKDVLPKLNMLTNKDQVVIDVASVKVYPAKLMKEYLKNSQILATHPMFGPDSARHGLAGLKVAFCPIRIDQKNLSLLRRFWEDHGAIVIETTPEAHDKDAIYSLALTHTISKIIVGMKIPDIVFDTRSFSSMSEVARLSAKDTDQLFHDMSFYNPYLSTMKKRFTKSVDKTLQQLNDIESDQISSVS